MDDAYIERSKWQLKNIDAVPFHRVIDGNIKLVMISHGMFTHFGGSTPASLNRRILKKRLRGEFGFEGVAISDDLGAIAWRFDGDVPKACVRSISRGMDVALLARDVHTAAACADQIYRAVRGGEISRFRIEQAVARVVALKEWLGLVP